MATSTIMGGIAARRTARCTLHAGKERGTRPGGAERGGAGCRGIRPPPSAAAPKRLGTTLFLPVNDYSRRKF